MDLITPVHSMSLKSVSEFVERLSWFANLKKHNILLGDFNIDVLSNVV